MRIIQCEYDLRNSLHRGLRARQRVLCTRQKWRTLMKDKLPRTRDKAMKEWERMGVGVVPWHRLHCKRIKHYRQMHVYITVVVCWDVGLGWGPCSLLELRHLFKIKHGLEECARKRTPSAWDPTKLAEIRWLQQLGAWPQGNADRQADKSLCAVQ